MYFEEKCGQTLQKWQSTGKGIAMHRYTPNNSKWTTLYSEIGNSLDNEAFQSAASLSHTNTIILFIVVLKDNQVGAKLALPILNCAM